MEVLPVINIKATSILENSNTVYNSNLVLDADKETAWVEGEVESAIGEVLTINLKEKSMVKEINLINGYAKNQDIYNKNNRVKKLGLEFEDGTYGVYDLKDADLNYQSIVLDEAVVTSYTNMEILEVYSGYKYNDTAISEISIKGIYNIKN